MYFSLSGSQLDISPRNQDLFSNKNIHSTTSRKEKLLLLEISGIFSEISYWYRLLLDSWWISGIVSCEDFSLRQAYHCHGMRFVITDSTQKLWKHMPQKFYQHSESDDGVRAWSSDLFRVLSATSSVTDFHMSSGKNSRRRRQPRRKNRICLILFPFFLYCFHSREVVEW